MSTTVANPTTIRELARYVEREHPDLSTSYNDQHKQLVVVGQPGHPEPSAALRETITSSGFEIGTQTVASRGRWLGVVTGPNGGKHGRNDLADAARELFSDGIDARVTNGGNGDNDRNSGEKRPMNEREQRGEGP